MTNPITTAGALYSSDATVEAWLPLGAAGAYDWFEIPGANSIDVDNGERPIQESDTFRNQIIQAGTKTNPTITIGIASYMPHDRVMQMINQLQVDKQFLGIRWSYPMRVLFTQTSGANNTVSISTAGVASFGSAVTDVDKRAIASGRIPEKMSLFIGSQGSFQDFIIEKKNFQAAPNEKLIDTLNVYDASTGRLPATAETDEAFGFRIPKIERPLVLGELMDAGDESAAASQAGLTSQIILRGLDELPAPVVVSN